jgi:hypothetical protein
VKSARYPITSAAKEKLMQPEHTDTRPSAILEAVVAQYVSEGFTAVNLTANSARLVKPKKFNWWLALLGLEPKGDVTFIYLLYYVLFAKNRIVSLSVDEAGRVHAKKLWLRGSSVAQAESQISG